MHTSNVLMRVVLILILFLAGFFALISGLSHPLQIITGILVICGQALLLIWLLARRLTGQEAAEQLRHREALSAEIVNKAPLALAGADHLTDRRAIEEELIKSQNLLSVALELAHLAPWEYDMEKDLFEFGDEFYAIYATDTAREGAFMGSKAYVREFVHPEDFWVVDAAIKKVTNDPHSHTYQLEHHIIRRDGEVRNIVVRMKVLRNAAGRIVKWWGANQDITEYKRTENALRQKTEEIRRLAYTDKLTGLPNRAYLNEKLALEISKIYTEDAAGMVLFIDLDDLKIVNETFGHTYGDALIIEAGKRIKEVVGDNAFVARVGGDEFLTIIPGLVDRRLMKCFAAKIAYVLCQDFEVFGEYFHMSASAGAAIYPDDGDTAEEIFKNADNAMYAAKNSGKNCWRFYDDTMQKTAYEKMLLTNSLRFAIQRQELSLYYQPQVRTADGVTVGFEALLRWHSPEYGTISPARFIPLAEQSKQIDAIGNWVLREACRFARRLADKSAENIYVSVNVSPHQLSGDGFIANVCNALREAGIQPSQLVIEITENALISSLKESNLKLRELQSLGVRLALDDFGTGYSSLTYLQRLPVKTLKIDKSFTDMILLDGSHKAIIASIVDMAHAMEICVVAEGVETTEQIDYLTKCRCDLLQGYVISRPVPEKDILPFLPRQP